jgi:hypothetical protein
LPEAVTGPTRLQAGRLRDPLLASHILAGFLSIEVGWSVVAGVRALVSAPLLEPLTATIRSMNSPGYFAARILNSVVLALSYGMGFPLIVVLLRLALRRRLKQAADRSHLGPRLGRLQHFH